MVLTLLFNQPFGAPTASDRSPDVLSLSLPADSASPHPCDPDAGASQTANVTAVTSKSTPTKRERRKDPAWDEVIIADGIASCKRCDRTIHQLGETHVERVRHHLQNKCCKRLKTKAITSCFPAALTPSNLTAFKKQFALWFYSTGMAFDKASHPTLLLALQILHPGVAIPSPYELATTLLNMCYSDFKMMMSHKLRGKKCTLNTDGWTDINGKSVINYVLECEGESYFLESTYTGSTSHDAEFLALVSSVLLNLLSLPQLLPLSLIIQRPTG
ncbi:hypothetical protein PI125_g13986 [Phytophthora idaei]|nr:hypothetical protein PI125_g13986 [Phytophthora idaei]KAG3146922.1 hypothetical protein PI126_g13099 [Phytophthora idaei]